MADEIRKCPACGRTINSINDYVYCSRKDPCPPRAEHNAPSTGATKPEWESEEHFLQWMWAKMMGAAKSAEVVVEDEVAKIEGFFGRAAVEPVSSSLPDAPLAEPPVAHSVESAGGISSEGVELVAVAEEPGKTAGA